MSATAYTLFLAEPDGRCRLVGRWLPPRATAGQAVFTRDPATAERWRLALAEGRLPDLDPSPSAVEQPDPDRPLTAHAPDR